MTDSNTYIETDTISPLNENPNDNIYRNMLEDLNEFTYSKKKHLEYFLSENYDELLFNKKIEVEDCDVIEYQCMLVYHFIVTNVAKGSRLLELGDQNSNMASVLSADYELWKLEDTELLMSPKFDDSEIKPISKVENQNMVRNKNSYFDMVYSISGFEKYVKDELLLRSYIVIQNINKLTAENGQNVLNFIVAESSFRPYLNNFFFQFFKMHRFSNRTINKYIEPNQLIILPDALKFDKHPMSWNHTLKIQDLNNRVKVVSFTVFLKKNILLSEYTYTHVSDSRKQFPVYYFHHLMKCGGTSLHNILDAWFIMEFDQLEASKNRETFLKYRFNNLTLNGDTCVTGHFQYEGIYLKQRYPEIYHNKNEFRIFTFVREPLSLRISHYYYLKARGMFNNVDLIEYLKVDKNFIATLFPANIDNYKDVIDEYFFVGIVERMQESMDKLAELIGKRKLEIPVVNTSKKDNQLEKITPEFRSNFKKENHLDYLIYDYCLKKFESF